MGLYSLLATRPIVACAVTCMLVGGAVLASGSSWATQPVIRPKAKENLNEYLRNYQHETRATAIVALNDDDCERNGRSYKLLDELLLNVVINEHGTREVARFYQRKCGALLARVLDLDRWRIITADRPVVTIANEAYVNLNSFPKLTYAIDTATQTLQIEGEPEIFRPSVVYYLEDRTVNSRPSTWAANLSLGISGTGSTGENKDLRFGGGLTGTVFSPWGSLQSSRIAFEREDGSISSRHIATFFEKTFIAKSTRLRIGTLSSGVSLLSGSNRLLGFEYARDFSVQPYYITTPLQSFDGMLRRYSATTLSGTDFIPQEAEFNGRRFGALLGDIPYGPVDIRNVPYYHNGVYQLDYRNEVTQEITSFYRNQFNNRGLLRQGLTDFSYQVGVNRAQPRANNLQLSAAHRIGLSHYWTAGGFFTATRGSAIAGYLSQLAVPWAGVVGTTISQSRQYNSDRTGTSILATLTNDYRLFSYQSTYEYRSRKFSEFGNSGNINSFNSRFNTAAFYKLPWRDNINIGYSQQTFRGAEPNRGFVVNYALRQFRQFPFNLTVGHTISPNANTFVSSSVSFTFGQASKLAGNIIDTLQSREPNAQNSPTLGPSSSSLEPGALARDISVIYPHNDRIFSTSRVNSTNGEYASFNAQARYIEDANKNLDGNYGIAVGRNLGSGTLGGQVSTGFSSDSPVNLSASYSNSYFDSFAGYSKSRTTNRADTYNFGVGSSISITSGGISFTKRSNLSSALVRLGKNFPGVRVNGVRTNRNGDAVITDLAPFIVNTLYIEPTDLPLNAIIDQRALEFIPPTNGTIEIIVPITLNRDALVSIVLRAKNGDLIVLPQSAVVELVGSEQLFPISEEGTVYLQNIGDNARVRVRYRSRTCTILLTLPTPKVNSGRASSDDVPELGPLVCEGIEP